MYFRNDYWLQYRYRLIFDVLTKKNSRIVCLHIQIIDIYLTTRQNAVFHSRLVNFETFSFGRLVRRAAFAYTYIFKVCVCVKLGNLLSKKCKVSFLVQ